MARVPLGRAGAGPDESRLAHALEQREQQHRLARILLEVGEVPEQLHGRLLRASADGHRDDRRRGLPMIGRGVSGARVDQDPLRSLLAKEGHRRR